MKLLVAAVLVLAACGSSPQSTTTPTPTPTPPPPQEGQGSGATATVTLPDVPFADLNQEQRIAFMKQKVMPVIMPVFQNHDPKDYAKFGCVVCHGEQAKQGHFDMPNPKLPKLDFNDLSEFKKEDLEWMGKEVMPTMAKVLNLPLFSKDNPKGFGCLACHTLKGKDDHNDHDHDHGHRHDK
jgi:mono/diheme cytochrome c family protein